MVILCNCSVFVFLHYMHSPFTHIQDTSTCSLDKQGLNRWSLNKWATRFICWAPPVQIHSYTPALQVPVQSVQGSGSVEIDVRWMELTLMDWSWTAKGWLFSVHVHVFGCVCVSEKVWEGQAISEAFSCVSAYESLAVTCPVIGLLSSGLSHTHRPDSLSTAEKS